MAKARTLVYGLEIFMRYLPDFYVEAEHDCIYGPAEDEPELDLDDLEIKHLREDGWFIESGCWAINC